MHIKRQGNCASHYIIHIISVPLHSEDVYITNAYSLILMFSYQLFDLYKLIRGVVQCCDVTTE